MWTAFLEAFCNENCNEESVKQMLKGVSFEISTGEIA